jgi:alpha-galactosidase
VFASPGGRNELADTAVQFHAGPTAGVTYRSGLTVYDEALVDGRWVGRYWSATGTIKPQRHLNEDKRAFDLLPADAFVLRIGDHVLDRHWRWVGAEEIPAERSACRHVVVELAQQEHPIAVKVHTCFDGSPFLVRWLEITNGSDRPVSLAQVTPFAGLIWWLRDYTECVAPGDPVFSLGFYEGSAPEEEGNIVWCPLPAGSRIVEGRNGRSGHGRPSIMLRNEANGEALVAELGWSSNWRIAVTVEQNEPTREARLYVALGPFAADQTMRVIEPHETILTPRVHLGHLHADLDGCVQALHRHIRSAVLPPRPAGKIGLIEANHRGYLIDVESEEGIKREIDIAAAMGAEVFVIDAGWYGPEPNRWSLNVGDWYAGSWLPNDLYPLVDHAHQRGLLFGLWAEIESIGLNARLRQEHPDWILTRHGEPPDGIGRHLDVANPAVAAWMEAEIVRLISQYRLDLFRLDYNSVIYEGGTRERDGFVENTLWRHVETIWGIFERLRRRFPEVIFESCASGGGRLDLGLLRYFDLTEITDWMPAPRSLKILNGITLTLPPEICLNTFGTEIADHYLYGDLDFLIRTCLFGHPILRGIAPSLQEIGEPRRSRIAHALGLYKTFIRPMSPDMRVFHHTPVLPLRKRPPWCVLEYAARDGSREVVGIFRLTAPGHAHYRYRARGLRAGSRYRVTFDNSGEAVELSGLELQRDGVELRLESPLTSELLLIERIGEV